MTTDSITLEKLIELARRGKGDDWKFIDAYLKAEGVKPNFFVWGMKKIFRPAQDNNERDLAATFLMLSDTSIDRADLQLLESCMLEDPHNIVRYRLAMALYNRDYRYPDVRKVMGEATKDPDVGELARKFLAQP